MTRGGLDRLDPDRGHLPASGDRLARFDEEISEVHRHFESASTERDYSNVGNDCVSTLEALSGAEYDHAEHGRPGEDEPPVARTKDRLDRVIKSV